MKNGFPSVNSCSLVTRSASGASPAPKIAAIIRATSARPRRLSASSTVARPRSSSARKCASDRSTSSDRYVTSSTTGRSRVRRATDSRNSRLVASLQCRSSMIRRSGASFASRTIGWRSAWNSRCFSCSGSPAGAPGDAPNSSRSSGISFTRSPASLPNAVARSSRGAVAMNDRHRSISGANGTDASCSKHPPLSTRPAGDSSRARPASSSTSRDFPIPASPATVMVSPAPSSVAANARSNRTRHSSRPIRIGQVMEVSRLLRIFGRSAEPLTGTSSG